MDNIHKLGGEKISRSKQLEPEFVATSELLGLKPIRVETALSRFPVHRLARKGQIDINLKGGNKGDETRWEVDYSKKHGQPGPLAYKIDTLIINRRIEEARRPLPKLIRLGSLKELCRELGISETGGNTNQIKKSLFQNALAGITAKTRYRTNDGTEHTLEGVFTRYSVILTGETLPNGNKADCVYIVLNDIFMQVINGAMTRPLDYDYLKELTPAAQRFYELLSYQIYAAIKYDLGRAKLIYSEFCSHAPQTRHVDWDKVRSQMHKIHRPHKESGYISKVEFRPTTDVDGQPDWFMLYTPGPKARAEYRAFARRGGPSIVEIAPIEEDRMPLFDGGTELEQTLIGRGITAGMARELIASYPEERILAQIERVDWLIDRKKGKVEDPAAYLVGAIRNDYAPPKGFVSNAERERLAEAKVAKERDIQAKRRVEQERKAEEKRAEGAIDAYWKSLGKEGQAALQAEIDAATDLEVLKAEDGPLKRMGQRIRREAHILAMLRADGRLP